ncbi:hypothetical protein VTN49DRAFT_4673 [Thermomyces lanuginosus]|uniref:uncharacterized protein n=1 Tax=Thermomyces lanuginosus TaxID=5541 RepID=UPI00374450D6
MIRAIFYSKFDTQEGPKVVHQVPDGAIVPSSDPATQQTPFFTFSDISFYVIPRQELCGNLIQVCINGYRVLGYPICMKSPRYDRNEFIFNFCIVLAEDEDFGMYKSVVQKLADLMHGLEEQKGFLSRDNSHSNEGKVYSLCETLMEDLNNYSECMIPIDELNTLNIKLFPVYPAPPQVKAWDVPLFAVRYETFMDENWDLTMQKIVPYINGVNSVRVISILADVELSLAIKAIRHLLYYGCIFLLDIFSFSAIYAPTAQFGSTIASDEGMQQECARYVNTRFAPVPLGSISGRDQARHRPGSARSTDGTNGSVSGSVGATHPDIEDIWPLMGEDDDNADHDHRSHPHDSHSSHRRPRVVDGVGLVELYAALKQGQSVKQWYLQHSAKLANIDVRRFIAFGIIKGFLYRVHKYAYGPRPPGFVTNNSNNTSATASAGAASRPRTPASTATPHEDAADDNHPTGSSFQSTPGTARQDDYRPHSQQQQDDQSTITDVHTEVDDFESDPINRALEKYLDGQHCFDEICTELQISEKELTARLKAWPWEVQIIHR